MDIAQFYDDVLIDCERCPVPVALAAVRHAARELCDKSRIWVITTDPVALVAAQASYAITVPNDTEVVEVQGGYFNDAKLPPKTDDQLDALFGRWQALVGAPRYITQDQPNKPIVVPVPASTDIQAADRLRFRVALRPTLIATAFDPDAIWVNDYYATLLHGAKARLMASPGKPYSNLKLSDFHNAKFAAGVNNARLQASRSRGRAEQFVEFPRYI